MIRAYTGRLGSGKSYCMVADAVDMFRRELRQVYTDIRSLRFPEAVYLDAVSPEEIAMVSNGLILLDEAQILLSSRDWARLGADVRSALAQLRKNGLDLLYTTQDLMRVDTILREITGEEVRCVRWWKYIIQRSYHGNDTKPGGTRVRMLRPEVFSLYDTLEVVGRRVGVGMERSEVLERVRDARRASATRGPKLQEAGWKHPVWPWRVKDNQWSLGTAARTVLSGPWASELGRGSGWAQNVADELARAKWLAYFGLAPSEVPPRCSFSWPWAEGCSPVERDEFRARQESESEDEGKRNGRSRSARR